MEREKGNKNEVSWTVSAVALLLGIIFILVAIISDNFFVIDNSKIANTIIGIISKGVSAVGISLVVGFLTSQIQKEDKKQKERKEEERLKELLQNIVISQNFIDKLTQESKANIIKNCLSNNDENSKMSEYILHKIKKLQQINDCTIRSNIDYTTTASMRGNCVVLKTVMSYRIYPQNGKYSKIQHDFEKETGKILEMKIISPNGETYTVPSEQLKTKEETRHFNDKIFTNCIQIPEKYNGEKSLTLKITVEETGFDHWAHLVWMSLYPTETISYKVICQNNLIIKEHMIFDNQKGLYYVQEEKDDEGHIIEYTISCDKWTDPYTGFALVVSQP